MKIALVTGVTGFIGGELVRHLLEAGAFDKIYLVIRGNSSSAQERWESIQKRWESLHKKKYQVDHVDVLDVDLFQSGNLDLPLDVTHIYHSAASTRFDESLSFARNQNLYVTQKLAHWASRIPSLKAFVHFSTAFVCGDRKGVITEEERPGRFHNNYEKTKYEAELFLKERKLPLIILRPSIVIGDSQTGYTQHFRVFYSMIRLWLQGKMPRAPLHHQRCVDMVPVDFVCRGAMSLSMQDEAIGKTFHLCAGEEGLVDPMSIFRYAIKIFNLGNPPISPVWVIHVLNFPLVRVFLSRPLKAYLETMGGHFPYMEPKKRYYSMVTSNSLLAKDGVECPKLVEYGDTMFRFCKESNWGRNLKGISYV